MCGITGQLAFPVAEPAIVRRGPDGEGFHSAGPIALGHRRLSIIDGAGGSQPMFNEDGNLAVVLNGEIYNYKELVPRHQWGPRLVTAGAASMGKETAIRGS